MIQNPLYVLSALLIVLAGLFSLDQHPKYRKIFNYVPLLIFAYFIPTLLSNLDIIPLKSPVYWHIKKWLLPASLILLTLSIDIPSILKLGRNTILLFLTGTVSVIIGAPIAYLILGHFAPEHMGVEIWKGLAALAGSWIGGGANFIAIGESVGAQQSTISMMVIVDVAVGNAWMAVLLYFAGKEKEMDEKIGADRSSIDELKEKVESFHARVARPVVLPDLLKIVAIGIGGTALATGASKVLPEIGSVVSGFTWIVIIVTTIGVGLSFTPVRNLEGAGASRVGSLFLYLLIASIGAQGEFSKILDAPAMVMIGFLWISIHAISILFVRKRLKAPIFLAAVGSQANIGAAASAPIVASAFHPALAPVGVLLGIAGYVLGTYGAILCAFLLEKVHYMIF